MHASRLHGFALLVTIGDEARAASAAAAAMKAGAKRAEELRHPERAAGWLRRQVIIELRRSWPTVPVTPAGWHEVLRRMHVTDTLISALESMTVERRAALVAGTIEGLELADVATTLDMDLARAGRAVEGARREYMDVAARSAAPAEVTLPGPLAQRIGDITARAIGPVPVRDADAVPVPIQEADAVPVPIQEAAARSGAAEEPVAGPVQDAESDLISVQEAK